VAGYPGSEEIQAGIGGPDVECAFCALVCGMDGGPCTARAHFVCGLCDGAPRVTTKLLSRNRVDTVRCLSREDHDARCAGRAQRAKTNERCNTRGGLGGSKIVKHATSGKVLPGGAI